MDIVPAPKVKGYLTKPLDFEALKSALLKAAPNPDNERPVAVLVADDDEEFSELVKMFLEANNYRPVIINDPLKALDAIRAEKPQVVLLDIMMPGKDGFQIMDEMQDEAETAKIPIIVLSALRFNNFQERGILTGLPEMISKDLPRDLLLGIIAQEIKDSSAPVAAIPTSPPSRDLMADDQTELLLL